MTRLSRRHALRAGFLYASLAGQTPSFAARGTPGDGELPGSGLVTDWIHVGDVRFAGGAKGDGKTDDTAALTAAIALAVTLGRPLYMPGRYAVAELGLSGLGHPLRIVGNPVLVQARPDVCCLRVIRDPLQQLIWCDFSCTVIPHPLSSKANPRNLALDLTGLSSSDVTVHLGTSRTTDAGRGRFHTVIYADAASPFHYGNTVRLIANGVPSPRFGIRYGNRGKGVYANPNANAVSGWFTDLDTRPGDVLIDVGDTTQSIVAGPSLFEACPDATAIKAGNFTTIRDCWFERVGTSVDFTGTRDTTPNNCRVSRCNFSGDRHVIRIADDLGAPPSFDECLGDSTVSYHDQHGKPIRPGPATHSYLQPPPPAITFTQGGGDIFPDQASLRHRVDHHGRTTFQLRCRVTPQAPGIATMRLVLADGYEVEQASLGIRDANGAPQGWSLGDDLSGRDYNWVWQRAEPHVLNVRVTLRMTG